MEAPESLLHCYCRILSHWFDEGWVGWVGARLWAGALPLPAGRAAGALLTTTYCSAHEVSAVIYASQHLLHHTARNERIHPQWQRSVL